MRWGGEPRHELQVSSMTRTGRILTAIPVLAVMALAPTMANAHDFYRGGYGGYGGYRGGYGHRGFGGGAIVGGALLGLGLGAVIASQPRYYAPPPVVYAPPPVYYPPPYYAAPAYAAPAYPAPGYYPQPGYYPPGYYPR